MTLLMMRRKRFQEVKITEKALKMDKLTEFSTETEPHETAIAKDETNAEQACEILVESSLTAGAAMETEYEEHSEISEEKESLPSQKGKCCNFAMIARLIDQFIFVNF